MANSCVYIPSIGKDLFQSLKKEYGYEGAKEIFLRAISPEFKEDYKKSLELDEEGVPTMESLLKNSYMKDLMGLEHAKNIISKQYPKRDNNSDNYKLAVMDAYNFNTSNSLKDDYVAVVNVENDKVGVTVKVKNENSVNEFKSQYGVIQINDKLLDVFKPLNLSISELESNEMDKDYTKANNIASGFISMIKAAKGNNSNVVLSKEFTDLLIDLFENEPLMQRALASVNNNKDTLSEILQKNLINTENRITVPVNTLFDRLYSRIKTQFRSYNEDEISNTLNSIDSITSNLLDDILKGTHNKEDETKTKQKEAQISSLEERIQRNQDILKSAINVEVKRYKISKNNNRDAAQTTVSTLKTFTQKDADTVEGIFEYANYALKSLKDLETRFQLLDNMNTQQKFGFLRSVKMYVQSYSKFIEEIENAMLDEESLEDNMFLRDFEIDGKEINTQEVIKDLNQLSKSLMARYTKAAFPAFAEQLKPFLGNEITVPFGKYAGTKMSVEQLLKEAQSDISFLDRWMQSMGDSADVILQGFDAMVKKANDKTRLEAIDYINKINIFREKVEKLGITDFEWAFERTDDGNKSGNYISEINYAQFEKDLSEFLAKLDEKYGKNPTSQKAQLKIEEKKAWLNVHAVSVFGNKEPNPELYRNKDYDRLSKIQKDVLNEFIEMKEYLDSMYPDYAVAGNKAIQIRKSGAERFFENLSTPSAIFDNIKERMKSDWLQAEDDDQIFGERSKRGLTDFVGEEFNVLPVLFTTRLRNPNELTTDLIGSLMAYTYAAIQYKHIDEIVDVLEVGKTLVSDERKVLETRGNNKVVEKIKALNTDVTNKVFTNRSNIEAKLKDFMDAHVYHRYLKDEGVIHIPFVNIDIPVNKAASKVLKWTSLAQLGFNWLANLANITTGMGIQNIEAASGQFFNFKEMIKADKEYSKAILPFVAELSNRTKTSKLALFFDLFNVKQNFEGKTKRLQTRNWLKRIFGENIAFLGQEAGDHWLYGRTAIAMSLREQILLNGKKMSLWEALQVQNVSGSETVKELNYKDIKNLDGTTFDVSKFSRKVAHVNQVCFGIYNDEDANAASRVAAGRLLQQYRKWMTIQYSRRFREGHKNLATDTWEEGYYRTFGRYLNELKRGGFQFAAAYNKMTSEEQANVKRAIFEMAQLFAVWCIANLIEWPDDKERPWALKLAEYSSKRLTHELGGLTPSFIMPREILKTVTNPVPASGAAVNLSNLITSAVDPTDWFDEMKSGPYKGLSTLQKNLIKSPLPIVAQYKQIDKFVGDLDNSINYYMRPY